MENYALRNNDLKYPKTDDYFRRSILFYECVSIRSYINPKRNCACMLEVAIIILLGHILEYSSITRSARAVLCWPGMQHQCQPKPHI